MMHRSLQKTCSTMAFLFAVFLTGCLVCDAPFYEEDQIVQDARIEGEFLNATERNREPGRGGGVWTIKPSSQQSGKYSVTVLDGPARSELLGTLFKLDDQLFLDLTMVQETKPYRVSGGPPTTSGIIHAILAKNKHAVWKVEITATGINYRFPYGNGDASAWLKAPELMPPAVTERQEQLKRNPPKTEFEAAGGTRMPVEGEDRILIPPDTKVAQKYLRRFASDDSIFNFTGSLVPSNAKK